MKAAAATFLLIALLLAGSGPMTAAAFVARGASPTTFHEVPTQVCTCGGGESGPAAAPGALRLSAALAPAAIYDEQIGTTFTQSFASLAFNVTAVEQTDPVSNDGPAYLLNGLASSGFWYQVGVSWNWNPGSNPGNGFDMNYEVFNTRGESIFPANGEGGLQTFSGPVNDGDSILLNLYFSSGNVVMTAHDWDTGASASETFSADGSTVFDGDTTANANNNGYFTGLMTEWYHPSPYTSNEKEVVYTEDTLAITSAWLWMDEYNPNNGQSIFSNETSSPVSFAGSPTKLQEFASNGATEYMDANELVTGALNATASTVPLTLSYSVVDGTTGSSPPILSYVSGGMNVNATLGTTPVTYNLDNGSSWSINATLPGSTDLERWQTTGQTSGTIKTAQTLELTYYHQYAASVSYKVEDGGAPVPTFTYESFGSQLKANATTQVEAHWLDAGSAFAMTNPVNGSTSSERWMSIDQTNGTVTTALDVSPTYYHQYLLNASYSIVGGGDFASGMVPEVTGTTVGHSISATVASSPSPVWLDAGSTYTVSEIIGNSTVGTTIMDQRWVTNATDGSVTSALTLDAQYQHQYLVTLLSGSTQGGSVSSSGGWYDTGAQLQANATANAGWQLQYWESASSLQPVSTKTELSIQVNAPVNDTAVFYPGLTITPGPDVSVSYSYPSTPAGVTVQGSVRAGQSVVIYVPPGGVKLSAATTSFLYSFKGWSGASSSTDRSITLLVSSPSSIGANSIFNPESVVIVLAAVLLAAIAIVAVATRGRKKTAASPAA